MDMQGFRFEFFWPALSTKLGFRHVSFQLLGRRWRLPLFEPHVLGFRPISVFSQHCPERTSARQSSPYHTSATSNTYSDSYSGNDMWVAPVWSGCIAYFRVYPVDGFSFASTVTILAP